MRWLTDPVLPVLYSIRTVRFESTAALERVHGIGPRTLAGLRGWVGVAEEQRGGDTAAVLYTLVATCKRLRIDPFAYLRDVFSRLPENTTDEALRDLLPDRWIGQNPQHRLAHRVNEDGQAKERRRKRRDRKRQLARANVK